jgi:hypothetical protein
LSCSWLFHWQNLQYHLQEHNHPTNPKCHQYDWVEFVLHTSDWNKLKIKKWNYKIPIWWKHSTLETNSLDKQ